jgi:hypothetical protein
LAKPLRPNGHRTVRGLIVGAVLLGGARPAVAAIHVFSPIVEEGEVELETFFDRTNDPRPTKDNGYTYNVDIGYGVTSFWKTEIEAQWTHDPQGKLHYDATSSENVFQLTPQGAYWMTLGLFAEYELVARKGDHDSITLGPILQKEFGRNVTTLNLFLSHELGHGSAGGLEVDGRLQSVWRVHPAFAPGFEAYWEPGKLGSFQSVSEERLRAGPAAVGTFRLGQVGKLKYEIAYLFGMTGASEHGTLRGLLEYEIFF